LDLDPLNTSKRENPKGQLDVPFIPSYHKTSKSAASPDLTKHSIPSSSLLTEPTSKAGKKVQSKMPAVVPIPCNKPKPSRPAPVPIEKEFIKGESSCCGGPPSDFPDIFGSDELKELADVLLELEAEGGDSEMLAQAENWEDLLTKKLEETTQRDAIESSTLDKKLVTRAIEQVTAKTCPPTYWIDSSDDDSPVRAEIHSRVYDHIVNRVESKKKKKNSH
jgi:hypothetical protein